MNRSLKSILVVGLTSFGFLSTAAFAEAPKKAEKHAEKHDKHPAKKAKDAKTPEAKKEKEPTKSPAPAGATGEEPSSEEGMEE